MAKIIVSLPTGWDNKLLVDSKDFALLCDILERSVGFSNEYRQKTQEYVPVAKELVLEGTAGRMPAIVSRPIWEQTLAEDKAAEQIEVLEAV